MHSWQMFYLAATVLFTGAMAGPSNGATLALFMLAMFHFIIAFALRAIV